MLLPSATANPANIMAQALTMYKSLLGNVSSNTSHEPSSPELTEGIKDSGEAIGKSTTFSSTVDSSQLNEPRFSLQSPRKGD